MVIECKHVWGYISDYLDAAFAGGRTIRWG